MIWDKFHHTVWEELCEEGEPMPGTTVVIMLSTWNGERFLTEQLESLLAQDGDFNLKLEIRDDGSTDGTVPMMKDFCDRLSGRSRAHGSYSSSAGHFSPVEASLSQGENLGFVGSFFELLRQSAEGADWYAFCDQDDVWQPDKLQRAIRLLNQVEVNPPEKQMERDPAENQVEHGSAGKNVERDVTGSPLLYTSRLQLTDAALQPIGYTAMVRLMPSFQNALVENIVTGATLVMNRMARDLLLEGIAQLTHPESGNTVPVNNDPSTKGSLSIKDVLLHDWWCYLVVSAFGRVLYDPESRILYRQHGRNAIGQQRGFIARQKSRMRRLWHQGNVRGITRQVQLFFSIYAERLPQRSQQVLTRFLARDATLWTRITYAIRPDVQRQTWYDNVIVRVLLLFGKI